MFFFVLLRVQEILSLFFCVSFYCDFQVLFLCISFGLPNVYETSDGEQEVFTIQFATDVSFFKLLRVQFEDFLNQIFFIIGEKRQFFL